MAVLGEGSAIFHVRARLTVGLGGGSSLLFSALGDATSKVSCWMEDYWVSDDSLGKVAGGTYGRSHAMATIERCAVHCWHLSNDQSSSNEVPRIILSERNISVLEKLL
jgi:hypothetical protein